MWKLNKCKSRDFLKKDESRGFDSLKSVLKACDSGTGKWEEVALDRPAWRSVCYEATASFEWARIASLKEIISDERRFVLPLPQHLPLQRPMAAFIVADAGESAADPGSGYLVT